ncbi:helix-turn-helix domain-containing protein [Paraburkholderia diazotrophica]|uniref:helix-turn-helix domain-containing protein n=1 Tax=Paraburkholderia diazotrophica TaxID=667676 RepID=UPI003D17E62D
MKEPLQAIEIRASRGLTTQQQRDVVLQLLSRRPAHTHELRSQGVSHPAARVMELRRAGYQIDSSRVATVDSDGFAHYGVALYSLIESPSPVIYQGPAAIIGAGYGSAGAYVTVPTSTMQ